MAIFHFGFAVHARDVIGDEGHRAGAVKRHHCDNVFHRLGFHLHHVARHPRSFDLEKSCGIARAHQGKGFRIIQRNIVQVELNAVTFLDQVASLGHDGQRDEAEEVYL